MEKKENWVVKINYSLISRGNNQSAAVPEPTMLFAALCLRNALYLVKNCLKKLRNNEFTSTTMREELPSTLVNKAEEENPRESPENNDWMNINENGCCNPSGAIDKDALEKLHTSIYAATSYVSLRLGDYVTALNTAKELLHMENVSDAYK